MSTPNLIDILRDIFVKCLAEIAELKLQKIEEPSCILMHDHKHDTCYIMSKEERITIYLPSILQKITIDEVGEGIRTAFSEYDQKEMLKEQLQKKLRFCIRTFLYICFKDMCSDIFFQSRIAEVIYTGHHKSKFGDQYRHFHAPSVQRIKQLLD